MTALHDIVSGLIDAWTSKNDELIHKHWDESCLVVGRYEDVYLAACPCTCCVCAKSTATRGSTHTVEYVSLATTEMCSKFLNDVVQCHVEAAENKCAELTLVLAVLSKENTELKLRLRDIADERNH